jgi:hypothetical protein
MVTSLSLKNKLAMASYLQKLRKQSKQPAAQQTPTMQEPPKADTPKADTPKVEETAPNTSGSVPHSHAPTVTEVSDEPAAEPVLDEEDQKFLERLAAIAQEPEGIPPQLPARPTEVISGPGEKMVGKDAQEALMAGADKIALPQSPPEGGLGRKKSVLSYFALPKFKRGDKQKESTLANKGKANVTEKDRAKLADDLLAVAESSKSAEMTEAEKEQQDLTKILEELNLSAVNNRVFSFSKESEELLSKFTLVLKDIVNGAPTAYNDLEKLFTDYDAQLKKMYGGLPPFLQNLVKGLPAKLTASLGPEFLAAQAEKPGFDAKQRAAGSSSGKRSKIPGIPTIPSLKQLVTAQGAVATALRSILNFLKFRFPALAGGTNMLMSLAVFRKSSYTSTLRPSLTLTSPSPPLRFLVLP